MEWRLGGSLENAPQERIMSTKDLRALFWRQVKKHQQLAHVRLLQRGETWMLGHVHGDATVDVQNQICPLASSDLFLS